MPKVKAFKPLDFAVEDFRSRAVYSLTVSLFLLLTPFAVIHWVSDRHDMALGAMLVIAILAFNLCMHGRGHNLDGVNLWLLSPIVSLFLGFGILNQGHLAAFWGFPALLSFYCFMPVRKAMLANGFLLLVLSVAAIICMPVELWARMICALFGSSIFAGIMVTAVDRQHSMLQDKIVTDHLTGVFNRSLLEPTLESAISLRKNSNKPMTLLSVDVDHFKNINDTFGHGDGDSVLRSIAQLLLERSRKSDYVFRVGGEEFLILLTGSNFSDGAQVAESIRSSVAELNLLPEHPVTVSLGVAELHKNEQRKSWLRRADRNLYVAKEQGRNQVVVQ